jgi:hypothetical protein
MSDFVPTAAVVDKNMTHLLPALLVPSGVFKKRVRCSAYKYESLYTDYYTQGPLLPAGNQYSGGCKSRQTVSPYLGLRVGCATPEKVVILIPPDQILTGWCVSVRQLRIRIKAAPDLAKLDRTRIDPKNVEREHQRRCRDTRDQDRGREARRQWNDCYYHRTCS